MTGKRLVDDPATKLRTALAMADAGVAMKRESLRRSHPEATDEEISKLLHEWLGSKRSDFPGVVGTWPRKTR
ncbi:MAG: hypothetical protein ABI782_00855 [Anaerolineaceae bacterium]